MTQQDNPVAESYLVNGSEGRLSWSLQKNQQIGLGDFVKESVRRTLVSHEIELSLAQRRRDEFLHERSLVIVPFRRSAESYCREACLVW